MSTPHSQLGSEELHALELREAFCQLCILNSVTAQVLPLADIFGLVGFPDRVRRTVGEHVFMGRVNLRVSVPLHTDCLYI